MRTRIVFFGTVLLALLTSLLLVNYFSVRSAPDQIQPLVPLPVSDSAIERLSQAIRIPTVSAQFNPTVFISFLQNQFPTLHQQLDVKVINGGSLIFHWRASTAQGKPILLLAHYDVVPASDRDWRQPAFSGHIDEQFIWGRGSMDDKASLMAMLEAVELLLRNGYEPKRDIYLAFGHDEELGGQQGAAHIAQYFEQQHLTFDYVLDEGLVITEGILTFVDQPVALIGVAEKGYADIELSLAGSGGHASMPGQRTLLGDLSHAISKLQASPLAARLTLATRQMLVTLAPDAHALARLSFTNLWLFKPLVMHQFAQSPATHAAINTTFAPTQMFASDAPNVLPDQVRANINVRMLPGTTSQAVVEHIRQVIDDARIRVRIMQVTEASTIASTESPAYRQLRQSVHEVFARTLVAPGIVIPATDSRHYQALALQTYRFLPILVNRQDLTRFHGRNERIGKGAYQDMIRFYYRCLINSTAS